MYCMYWRVISAMRNIEHVEILAPDQVQQQVERALEGLEKDLERLRRDVQIARQLRDRLAIDDGERHLHLFRLHRGTAAAAQDRSRPRSSAPVS